jgi:hypothetical protein
LKNKTLSADGHAIFHGNLEMRKRFALAEIMAGLDSNGTKGLSASTPAWLEKRQTKLEMLFLLVGRIHAQKGLHGQWLVEPGLSVVAQIRALTEEDNSLDTLLDKLPLDTIMRTAGWADLEENS